MEVLSKIIGQRMNVSQAVSSGRIYSDLTTVYYDGSYPAAQLLCKSKVKRPQTSADPEDPDFELWTPGSEA